MNDFEEYLAKLMHQKKPQEGKLKYTDDDFMDAINALSKTSHPDCTSFDCYREVIAYFKKHPEAAVKPYGRLDSIEEVLTLIYPIDGK